jgi:excinuclease ABC subunit C
LTPTEQDYRHCLYGNLKFCTAPCIGNVSQDEYRQQVKAACEFLTGQTAEMEEQLDEAMRKAAAAQDFENAARYRDALADLRKTTQRTTRFERTPWNLPVAVMPDGTTPNSAKSWLARAARTNRRIRYFKHWWTLKVASVVSFRNGRPDRANYRRMRIKTVEGQDDLLMAEAVRRRPHAYCVKRASDSRRRGGANCWRGRIRRRRNQGHSAGVANPYQ